MPGSWNQHHLADALPRLDELVRELDVLEWYLGADERLQCSGLPVREQLSDCRPDELRIEAEQPAEVEPDHADVAAHDPSRLAGVPGSRRRADGDCHAERPQQRERGGKDVAAD